MPEIEVLHVIIIFLGKSAYVYFKGHLPDWAISTNELWTEVFSETNRFILMIFLSSIRVFWVFIFTDVTKF